MQLTTNKFTEIHVMKVVISENEQLLARSFLVGSSSADREDIE